MLRLSNDGNEPDPKGGTVRLYKPHDTTIIKLRDNRKINPTTGKPFKTPGGKSLDVDQDVVTDIIAHAKAKGIDPYDALAISYQETGLNKANPYNLNPNYFKGPTAGPEYGIETIATQMKFAEDQMRKGHVPRTEDFRLQGYNGYGRIYKDHADLEGAKSMYEVPIPDEGLNYAKTPFYGQTVRSLRDDILKKHPDIQRLVNDTPAYKKTLLRVTK